MKRPSVIFSFAALLMLNTRAIGDDKLPAEQVKFFESKVRPLLAEHCWKCHSADKQKGGLRLDSRGAMLTGGESGTAVVAGKPDDSLLMEAVRYESLEMPPSGKLTKDQIETLATWIKLGAPWPHAGGAPEAQAEAKPTFSDEDRAWWAIQPRREVIPPDISDSIATVHNEVDQFIQSRLRSEGITPAPEADRAVLIRRVTFDLTGLPPTPEEVAAFVKETDGAYERLVDRLLNSPRFGERMARHWLDLVRYADGDGYRADDYRPHVWRYRDYVIQSFSRSTTTSRTIALCRNSWRAMNSFPTPRPRASPRAICDTASTNGTLAMCAASGMPF